MSMFLILEHEDLVNLVCGTQPGYDLFSELKEHGDYNEHRGWTWKRYTLKSVDETALWDMYHKIIASWLEVDQC